MANRKKITDLSRCRGGSVGARESCRPRILSAATGRDTICSPGFNDVFNLAHHWLSLLLFIGCITLGPHSMESKDAGIVMSRKKRAADVADDQDGIDQIRPAKVRKVAQNSATSSTANTPALPSASASAPTAVATAAGGSSAAAATLIPAIADGGPSAPRGIVARLCWAWLKWLYVCLQHHW